MRRASRRQFAVGRRRTGVAEPALGGSSFSVSALLGTPLASAARLSSFVDQERLDKLLEQLRRLGPEGVGATPTEARARGIDGPLGMTLFPRKARMVTDGRFPVLSSSDRTTTSTTFRSSSPELAGTGKTGSIRA